ncbi:MAG: efflux RND transporter periplasmic adaptor subunit [Phycisphaeraceae bacterium]|nr:efflux RND transporter periplasmic adaptor subunit [Phycisphaeraceae bacterium]
MKKWIKRVVFWLIVLSVGGGGAYWYLQKSNTQPVSFRTTDIQRGELLSSISATGTVEPEEVIDVGAQVAGLILSFGKDVNGKTIDYGSVVAEGTILAWIDDSIYTAELAQAQAQVQSAQAGLQRSVADLEQLKAKLHQAERDWERAQKLGPSEALSQSSFDAYQSAYETAKANVAIGQAAILQANASITQNQAMLSRAQRNLGYCIIKSPVQGVIIDRRVNIGQTVVASLNAPSLFLIAKDLTRMQVWVAVNEADIGKIRPGQPVTFTVDSFPGETFHGEVGKIRLNASMTQNVVTFTVEVVTDNSSGRLLPYLTANVQFELQRRDNVLLAPNAALRWTPANDQIAPEYRQAEADPAPTEAADHSRHRQSAMNNKDSADDAEYREAVIWVKDGSFVRPVSAQAGLTDGVMTEIQGDGVTEGLEVVTGVQVAESTPTTTTNPFMPQIRRGRSSPPPPPPPGG